MVKENFLCYKKQRRGKGIKEPNLHTVELQWLEQLWNHENMFKRGVVRATEYKFIVSGQKTQ